MIGCASTEVIEPTAPLPANLSRDELIFATKTEFNVALTNFYRDNWEHSASAAARLAEIAKRWTTIPSPSGREAEQKDSAARLSVAVAELQSAIASKDIVKTTMALRTIARESSVLQQLE